MENIDFNAFEKDVISFTLHLTYTHMNILFKNLCADFLPWNHIEWYSIASYLESVVCSRFITKKTNYL